MKDIVAGFKPEVSSLICAFVFAKRTLQAGLRRATKLEEAFREMFLLAKIFEPGKICSKISSATPGVGIPTAVAPAFF